MEASRPPAYYIELCYLGVDMRLCVLFVFLALSRITFAQAPVSVPLWPNGAPGALGNDPSDQPTLTIYMPWEKAENRTAVIVCPGGGYGMLADNHEGRQVANWLNSLGFAAFVLKYRLGPRYHHPIELGDAQRAIRMVRAKAKEYGVAPDRIGIMGFSAGGHLASTAGTHFDAGNSGDPDPIQRVGSRPDFLVLGYPVISFTAPFTHRGSLRNLLGDNPDPKLAGEPVQRIAGDRANASDVFVPHQR